MLRYGIITAMESEMAEIAALIGDKTSERRAGLDFLSGRVAGRDVVCVVCGMGKVNAAMAAQEMITTYAPDCLINVGVAGGLSPEARHGTVVVADRLWYHDVIIEGLGDVYPYMEPFAADPRLIAAAKRAAGDANVIVGGIVTGDEFVTCAKKSRELHERYGAHACEMEGAAIAHVAHCNGLPFAGIRAISDMADEDSPVTFAEFEHIAARQGAEIVIGMIKEGNIR